jgi:transcriptional regulator with XRE-family HTH domain
MHKLKIKEYREKKKWSQRRLSIVSGVSQTAISAIESLVKSPAIDTMEKLGKALGVCPHDLVKFNHSYPFKWGCNE